ncbi:MAG TPA: type I DNA topoisomerase [Terriglobia bacterium]|jgi:DNA topoisomerase-1|nr:type I DNA topoisomerase [Terriglobia bacterium]
MGKSLVIVESPAKAKTINRYLGSGYTVKASMGHVMDLPKKELGVDLENNFKPIYEVIPSKKETIKSLKAAAKDADTIYLAADPDREGEAICAHLRELLDSKKRKFYRVLFNEITREAIEKAFKNPQEIDSRLVDAQQARRVLDRLVGYQVSPLLWDKVRRGISAGRVQTVALRLIVEREREIQAFQKREYWTIAAKLEGKNPPPFEARLLKFQDQELEVPDQAAADAHRAALEKATFRVSSVETRERRKYPVPPFITSKLQQEAVRKLRFTARKTMTLAQKLYEGVDLGEGPVGLITYMRTDSTRVAESALESVRAYIRKTYGDEYLPPEAIHYKSKKGAQDAHEAIRPTSMDRPPESLRGHLSPDELKLYRLIWQRFVASQMNPAVFDQTTIDIAAGDYLLRATGSVEKFKGFRAVYEEGQDDKAEGDDDEAKSSLPVVEQGEVLKLLGINPEQHFTEPPPRYNEATLVKALEEKGIGRPSTYATILSVIQNRDYVEKQQGRFLPTELGMVVNDLLVKSFSDIFDVAYTARMEEELDEVEEGKLSWTRALDEFYKKFKKDLKAAEREMADLKGEGVPTDVKCEKCGKPMVVRLGRNGHFLACTGYPDCNNTSDLTPELAAKYGSPAAAAPEVPEQTCEKCGRPMTLKRGRFGYFMACTGYPECRNTKKIVVKEGTATAVSDVPLDEKCPECGNNLVKKHGRYGEFIACSNYPKCKFVKRETLGIPCPEKGCTGEIVVRRTKKRKIFYGCTRYPDCKFTAWDKPVAEPCPQCGSPILLEKTNKKTGETTRYCWNESCKYERKVE